MQTTNQNQTSQAALCINCQEREARTANRCKACYARHLRARKRAERGLPPLPPRQPQPTPRPLEEVLAEARSREAELLPILTQVEHQARWIFRNVPFDKREELVSETIGVAWSEVIRMLGIGKDPVALAGQISCYSQRRVKDDRRFVHGTNPSLDVLSPLAQMKHDFLVLSINFHPRWRESPVLFVDLLDWIATLTDQEAELVELFTEGYSVEEVAERMDMLPEMVEAVRGELYEQWTDRCRGK